MDIYPIIRGEERTIGFDFAQLVSMYLSRFGVVVTLTGTIPEIRMLDAAGNDFASLMFVSATPVIAGTRATVKTKVPTAAQVPEGKYTIEWEVQLSNGDRPIGKDASGVRPELYLTG